MTRQLLRELAFLAGLCAVFVGLFIIGDLLIYGRVNW